MPPERRLILAASLLTMACGLRAVGLAAGDDGSNPSGDGGGPTSESGPGPAPSGGDTGVGDVDIDALDGGVVTEAGDAATDAPLAPLCDGADPTLLLCYRFEGSITDESGNGISPYLTSNLSYAAGRQGMALRLQPNPASDFRIANNALLRATTITFEMWIRPVSFPSSGRMMLVDLHNEIGVMLDPGGTIRCRAPDVTSSAQVQLDTWSHVACTLGGGTLRLYVNGIYQAQAASSNGSNTTDFSAIGQESPSGGDRFDGFVDTLRIWSTARTQLQITAAANGL